MRVELSSPHGRGGSGAAPAPDEVAAILAALAATAFVVVDASDPRGASGSRWKHAGRTYDAYDAVVRARRDA
ncbi:MAG: hypothetical protein NVS2B8_00150 [Vulcanimicrobiaceae bacterium]